MNTFQYYDAETFEPKEVSMDSELYGFITILHQHLAGWEYNPNGQDHGILVTPTVYNPVNGQFGIGVMLPRNVNEDGVKFRITVERV